MRRPPRARRRLRSDHLVCSGCRVAGFSKLPGNRATGQPGNLVTSPALITSLIIPALDEEDAIGTLLASIDRSVVRDVIVGDNGSRDATAIVAARGGATVVPVEERGYGAACAGALTKLADDVDVVLFMDADGSDDPNEINDVLAPIARGEADLVSSIFSTNIATPTSGRSARSAASSSTASTCRIAASAGPSRCRFARCSSARELLRFRCVIASASAARKSVEL